MRKKIYINGETVRLQKGQGVFINSRRLHYCICPKNESAVSLTALIHPSLFANVSNAARDYSLPKFSPKSDDYVILSPNIDWQKQILQSLLDLYDEISKVTQNPIRLISIGNSIIADICENLDTIASNKRDEHMQFVFLKMIDFMSANYQFDISVDDIAKAGSISRSQCTKMFRQILHESPIGYLRKLRIEKSKVLLRDTNLSVTEISLSCGISTSSYFISVFKNETGLTPIEYRKSFKETISANYLS